jgi:hypothetical protein
MHAELPHVHVLPAEPGTGRSPRQALAWPPKQLRMFVLGLLTDAESL